MLIKGKAYSGLFHLLPLGVRVQEKLERLIDKYMRRLGSSTIKFVQFDDFELTLCFDLFRRFQILVVFNIIRRPMASIRTIEERFLRGVLSYHLEYEWLY